MRRRTLLATGLLSGLVPLRAGHAQAIEKRDVSVSIGSWIIQYLPLPVAVAQGYFKDEGLDVTVNNFDAGGSKALQALLGGSTDMVVGFYDHTIQMWMDRTDKVRTAQRDYMATQVFPSPEAIGMPASAANPPSATPPPTAAPRP